MATLTSLELARLRQIGARIYPVVTWTKPQVNAALQAIEDAVQSTGDVGNRSLRAYIAAAIETAAPGIFNVGQKDSLFVIWCRFNVVRGGIL